ncbi:MAG: hypothetical protein JWP12_2102 [Bacteroidetes bacterium]|nr:hypothetical protein [Bacteroidota bacterium]
MNHWPEQTIEISEQKFDMIRFDNCKHKIDP